MTTRSQQRALLLYVALLFSLSAFMAWLVGRGLTRGETTLPMKQSTLRRTVSRVDEPGLYWASISIYAVISAGALGFGVFAWRTGRPPKR